MPRKPPKQRQKTDPEQHKRFLDMAREVEVDERPEAFERAFERVKGHLRKTGTQPPAQTSSPRKGAPERS